MDQHLHAFDRYLAEERGLSAASRRAYARDVRAFLERIADAGVDRLEAIAPAQVARYFAERKQAGLSAASEARTLASIRAFFRLMRRERIVWSDPTANYQSPRRDKPDTPGISTADVERLLGFATDGQDPFDLRDKAMLEMMYGTGARVSELIAMTADSAPPGLGFVRIVGPGGRERIMPLGAEAKRALEAYLRFGRPELMRHDSAEQALFLNRFGSRMSRQGFWKMLKKRASAADIEVPITPFTLRQSCAAHMLANGADLRTVQEMLGHADISTTGRYAGPIKPRMKDVYDRAHPRSKRQ